MAAGPRSPGSSTSPAMRSLFASFLSLGASIWFGSSIDILQTPPSALEALVERRLKNHSEQFVFHWGPQGKVNFKTHSELDTLTVFSREDGKVHVECSTTSACARGLYTYSYLRNTLAKLKVPYRGRKS